MAGLNIHGFSPMKFFKGMLLQWLGQKCLLFSIFKERRLFHNELRLSFTDEHQAIWGRIRLLQRIDNTNDLTLVLALVREMEGREAVGHVFPASEDSRMCAVIKCTRVYRNRQSTLFS